MRTGTISEYLESDRLSVAATVAEPESSGDARPGDDGQAVREAAAPPDRGDGGPSGLAQGASMD